jgi:pyruvate dehydrogenase E2 component (dihydrolipoamide acetyltransferase)
MPELLMPRLSDSMEEGTILKWLKTSGEEVRRGEEIVEIETDKATMTYEADADGVLEIVAGEGDTLPIGAVIARIGEAPGDGARDGGRRAEFDEPAETEAPVALQGTPPVVAAPGAEAPRQLVEPPSIATRPGGDGARIKASPVARRIARERGLDLGAVAGSGPGGRIVRADVEGTERATAPPPVTAPPPPTALPAGDVQMAKGEVRRQELTKTQQVIARRMASSKATVPDFQLQSEIDMERCVELRTRLRELASGERPAPSYNDMVVKASALALREHPRANGSYLDVQF